MEIEVNGTRLWFDVDGPALVPDGAEMRARPTIVLVHGGPGVYDHAYFKPDFARLAQHAQVVYLDLREHGRSEWTDAATWTLEACADDVRALTRSASTSPSSTGTRWGRRSFCSTARGIPGTRQG